MLPPAVVDSMKLIAQFELRALIEELLAASTTQAQQEVIAAMRLWLRLHCVACGALIQYDMRRSGESYCFACYPIPPEPGTGPDEVPF